MLTRGIFFSCRSHDNGKFASSGGDRSVFLWDVTSGVTDRRLPGHMGKINVVDFNEDATVLASGTWHKSIYHSEFMNFAIKDPLTRLSDSGTSAQCLEPPYRC